MAAKDSTPAPLTRYTGAIPGHLRELRSIAEAAGIAVRFGLLDGIRFGMRAGDENEPPNLCARLTGSPAAFALAGLAPPDFQCVRYRRTRDGPFPLAFVRTGTDELCADLVEDLPQLIEKRGRVEVAAYKGRWDERTERAYWGRPEVVARALRLPAGKLAPGKHGISRSGYDRILEGIRWQARFFPSGRVRLVRRDDPPAIARRRRLVESAKADAEFQVFLARLTDPPGGRDAV